MGTGTSQLAIKTTCCDKLSLFFEVYESFVPRDNGPRLCHGTSSLLGTAQRQQVGDTPSVLAAESLTRTTAWNGKDTTS